jgi:hypothetical protein
MLIESQGPTWMYGTASEHSVLYQYNLYNAANIFMAMVMNLIVIGPVFDGRLTQATRYKRKARTTHQHLKRLCLSDLQLGFSQAIQISRAGVKDSLLDVLLHGPFLLPGLSMSKSAALDSIAGLAAIHSSASMFKTANSLW